MASGSRVGSILTPDSILGELKIGKNRSCYCGSLARRNFNIYFKTPSIVTKYEALDLLERLLVQKSIVDFLTDLQVKIFLYCWDGESYSAIAEKVNHESDYVKKVGANLWQLASQALEMKVTKKKLQAIFRRYSHQLQKGSVGSTEIAAARDSEIPPNGSIKSDRFCGRAAELKQLRRWSQDRSCRAIAILGMGGIGKTTLATQLLETSKGEFDAAIWCSVRQAPLCTERRVRRGNLVQR